MELEIWEEAGHGCPARKKGWVECCEPARSKPFQPAFLGSTEPPIAALGAGPRRKHVGATEVLLGPVNAGCRQRR